MRFFIIDQLYNVFHGSSPNLGAKMNALVNTCERPAAMFWGRERLGAQCEAARFDWQATISKVVV